MSKQVILWCGSGGHGAKIIDADTGALLRENSRASVTTDYVDGYAEYQGYFYLVDTDSSLVCYDKDNVIQARIDLGYYDNPGEAIWTTSAGVHVLKKNKTFETFTAGTENLTKLMTYAHGTLAEVSAVVLTAAGLGDSGSNTSYIQTHDTVLVLDGAGFWVASNDTTTFPDGNGFVKVSYAGAVLDTWELVGLDWTRFEPAIGGVVYMVNSDTYALEWRIANFTSKTLGAVVGPTDISAAFLASTPNGVGSTESVNTTWKTTVIEANGSLTFSLSFDSADIAGSPQYDGMGKGAGICFINVTNAGVATVASVVPLPAYDNAKRAPTDPKWLTAKSARKLSGSLWAIGSNQGCWAVNAATGIVLWSFTFPYQTQQSYSGDGEYLTKLVTATWDTYTITGTVTDAAQGATSRLVRVYDQATGEAVTTATTDGTGEYTAELFSPRTKFMVCPSVDGTKNFEANAHVTPVIDTP